MSSKLLTPLVARGTQSPLFIVPAAGTTPFSLIRLARSLKGGHPVYSFEAPGMDDGLLLYDTIEDLATAYLAEIRTVQTTGPYYLGGHCAGAMIALEMVTQLEAQGDDVARLILLEAFISSNASTGGDDCNLPSSKESASMEQAMQTTYEHIFSQLARLPKDYAERFGKASFHFLHIAAQFRASSINAPIVLIRTQTHADSLYQGWSTITVSGIEEYIVPGNAFSILTPPVVATLGEYIDQQMK